jgi:hypothetical protein
MDTSSAAGIVLYTSGFRVFPPSFGVEIVVFSQRSRGPENVRKGGIHPWLWLACPNEASSVIGVSEVLDDDLTGRSFI